MNNAAIILCAGSGKRMRGCVTDKILADLNGVPVLGHSLKAFTESGSVQKIVFVCRDEEQKKCLEDIAGMHCPDMECSFAPGGAERQDSVLNGLENLGQEPGLVFIHDAARPLVGAENIRRLEKAAAEDGAAVLAARVVDTIKQAGGNPADTRHKALHDLDRKTLWAMQTPQVFEKNMILAAYREIKSQDLQITDDVAAAAHCGHCITLVENFSPNPKVTAPEDLAYVEYLMDKAQTWQK